MLAPPLRGSKVLLGHREGAVSVLLHGLTGPVDGKTYDALMVPMRDNDDRWIAAVLSFVRNAFGNRASLVTPEDVARVRARTGARQTPWTTAEVGALAPAPLPDRSGWKVSASHNAAKAALAIDGDPRSRYDTGAQQAPGMWFQVELPSETTVSALRLDAVPSPEDFPRRFEVRVSADGRAWTQVATGTGAGPSLEIDFRPTKARFIRIDQTGAAPGRYWSIHDLRVLRPASGS
jgi:hypothetical protein